MTRENGRAVQGCAYITTSFIPFTSSTTDYWQHYWDTDNTTEEGKEKADLDLQ
jgi:hypothetical protein